MPTGMSDLGIVRVLSKGKDPRLEGQISPVKDDEIGVTVSQAQPLELDEMDCDTPPSKRPEQTLEPVDELALWEVPLARRPPPGRAQPEAIAYPAALGPFLP